MRSLDSSFASALGAVAFLVVLATTGCPPSEPESTSSPVAVLAPSSQGAAEDPERVVGRAGDIVITAAELAEGVERKRFEVEDELFRYERAWVVDALAQRLHHEQARAAGKTPEALLAEHVTGPTEEEIVAVYAGRPDLTRSPELDRQVIDHLRAQAEVRYFRGILDAASFQVHLVAPDPPLVEVSVDDDPAKGPEDAPVTIVEFSDFECPACRQAAVQIPALLEQYPGKIRFVFRDFPLPMHARAVPAAAAAECAHDQGKFWEMHDLLFANQRRLGDTQLRGYAEQLGLDLAAFDTCMGEPGTLGEIELDVQAGDAAGVNSTPTFIVNGRIISSADLGRVRDLIEKALAQGS